MDAIEKIQFRAANDGGRPFARPALLGKQMRCNKAQAARSKQPAGNDGQIGHRTTISLQGLMLARPDGLIASFMERVSETASIRFKHSGQESRLLPHEWTESRSPTGEWTGRVIVKSKSSTEVQNFVAKIHGCAIEVGGMSYVLEVKNLHARLNATKVQNFQRVDGHTAERTQQEWRQDEFGGS